jgi:hypothetical protein
MPTNNGRHKPPPLQLNTPPRTPSTRPDSSCSESKAQSPRAHSPQDQRKSPKLSGIRGFFAVKEPSAVALEKMAKQQRTDTARRGLQHPSGVTLGQLSPKRAEEDLKRQEAAAKKKAKLYEQKKEEKIRQSQDLQPSYRPEPITYHTLDPAAQSGGAYTTTAPPLRTLHPFSSQMRPAYTPESPRHIRLPSLDAVLEENRSQFHGRSTSSVSDVSPPSTSSARSFASSASTVIGSESHRKLAAPWEEEERKGFVPKEKGAWGFGS